MDSLQHNAEPRPGQQPAAPAAPTGPAVPAPAAPAEAAASTGPAIPSSPSFPDEPFQQVHHSYIWLGTLRVAGSLLIALAVSLLGTLGGQGIQDFIASTPWGLFAVVGAFAAGFVVMLLIVLIVHVFAYRHLRYQVGASEFNLYSGVFSKKHVHVPYQRIQSVDQHASLFQRIFGVCTVHVETAGGAANKAVIVPYVQNSQAEYLRAQLFARKQQVLGGQAAGPAVAQRPAAGNVLDAPAEIWQDVRGVFGGQAVDTGAVSYEYGLTNKELVYTGLSNNTLFVLVIVSVLGGIAQVASDLLPVIANQAQPVVGNAVSASIKLFGGNVIAAGVAAAIGAMALVWIASVLGTCISYGGFRACRRGSRIEVEHGLLQHRFQGVDIDRVQAVVVKQTFIRRLMGYCEVSLSKVDAGSDSSQDKQSRQTQGGLVVHPFVKMDRVPQILAGLVPEFADVPAQTTPVAPVALRRAVIRRCIIQGSGFWLAVLVALAQVVLNVLAATDAQVAQVLPTINLVAAVCYVVCVALAALDAVSAVLWARESGFAFNRHFMQVSNGGFSRQTASFQRKKIQYGYTKTNPFQRRANTATINARTAAGVGGTTVQLIDVCKEDAAEWLNWLEPGGNMVEC